MTTAQTKNNIEDPPARPGDFFMPKRIAIQGYEGSFHHLAALNYFGKSVEILPCASFRDVISAVSAGLDCDGGLMAIENSIAGSILPNYNLLQRSNLKIVGEIYLTVRQHLLVNKGVSMGDVREVHSHPMALQQCYDFLDKHNWKLMETEDTALSARHVHQHRSRHIAAIASKLAAELFELEILVPNIHTLKKNYTRFLALHREQSNENGADKASVNFHTDHSRGSLARVLAVIATEGINLSKLQSFPIPGSAFKYSFHADMEFDNIHQFENVVSRMKPITKAVNIYGIYKRGKWK